MADYNNVCKQTFENAMPCDKDVQPYSVKWLREMLTNANDEQPIIIEVGGKRIPLLHAFIAGECEDDGFDKIHEGCVVLDLDI